MSGDSDEDLLSEDQGEEADFTQATSEELRRLRIAARRQSQFQSAERTTAPEEEPDEEQPDQALEAGFDIPPLSPPPWPTMHFERTASVETPRRTRPLPRVRQPASPPPAAPSASRLKRTDPYLASQGKNSSGTSTLASDAGASALPGWRGFRRHSHWLIPGLLVAVLFALVLAVNPHLPVVSILLILAAIGVLQAGLLLYAPNDIFWAASLVGGLVVLLAVAFFIFFGPIFGFILSILLLALGGLAVRERYFPVKEGTVAVMWLFGRYNRTLQPGFNLRAPGEKVQGIVQTQKMRYEVRLPPITLLSGEQVTLSAAISYQVVPGQEYLAVRTTKDWQKPVQQQLVEVVQDVISGLSSDAFWHPGQRHQVAPGGLAPDEANAAQRASPLEQINEQLTIAMSNQLAERGVAVHAVKVHIIDGTRLSGGVGSASHPPQAAYPPASMPTSQPGAPGTPQGVSPAPPVATTSEMPSSRTGGTPVDWSAQGMLPPHQPGPPIAPVAGGATPTVGSAPPPPMTVLSAQALAETYDAVVRHRITDLGTIRRIIAQFEAVAANPELSRQVPFDAAAGARNLRNHLYQLEMRNASLLPSQGSASPPNGTPEES